MFWTILQIFLVIFMSIFGDKKPFLKGLVKFMEVGNFEVDLLERAPQVGRPLFGVFLPIFNFSEVKNW